MSNSEKRTAAERAYVSATKPAEPPGRGRTEREEETRTVDEKTARLRSLRLARDAADQEAALSQVNKAGKPSAKAASKQKRRKGDG